MSATDMQLTAPGSGLSVNISTGEAIVGGSEGGSQGGYYVRNASTTNLAIATANASNPRIDTICATISDAGYTEPTGGSGNQFSLQAVTGTATAGATLVNLSGKAALPLSSLLLGYVLVPATATNIITADIANVAQVVTLQTAASYYMAYNSSATSLTNNATTQVSLGGTESSGGAGWSVASNNLVVPVAGTYACSFQVTMGYVASTVLVSSLLHNGSQVRTGASINASVVVGVAASSPGSCLVTCAAGDTLGLQAFQAGSGAAQLTNTGPSNTFLQAYRAGS